MRGCSNGRPKIRASAAPPEVELLLCLARPRVDDAAAARATALACASLDWDLLVRLATTNRVVPLLHWNLERLCPDAAPPAVGRLLKDRFAQNSVRCARHAAELAQLARELQRRGIPALTFKGPVLSTSAYGHPALREFADLDVLVWPETIDAALDVLMARGYYEYDPLRPLERRAWRKYHFAHVLYHPVHQVEIDVHWSFLPRTWTIPLDYPGLWARAAPQSLGEAAMLTLHPEDLLLYLAIHGTKESWVRLRMVTDVAAVVSANPRLDWARALDRAAQQGGRRIFLLGMSLAADWLGAPVPAPIRAAGHADPALRAITETLWTHLAAGREHGSSVFVVSPYRLRMLDRTIDRLSYLVRTVTTPRLEHVRMVRLPPPLSPGYVPIKIAHDYLVLPLWRALKTARAGGAGSSVPPRS